MAAFTSKATGNWNSGGQTTWNEVNVPVAGDTVTIQNTHVVTQTQNEACAGLVVDVGGELDIATFNLANSSTTDVSGTLTGGISAGTGLTTVGLTFSSGALATMSTLFKVNNSGNYDCANGAVFGAVSTGRYTQTASGNYESPSAVNIWENFTIDAGVTITITDNTWITRYSSNDTIINGIIATGGFSINLGNDAAGSLTLGANSDFTGAGDILFSINSASTTITNSKTGAFSGTGRLSTAGIALANETLPALNWSNGNARVAVGGSIATNKYIRSSTNTLMCIDFDVYHTGTAAPTIQMDVTNANLEISGDVDLNAGGGTYTTAWDKGTGTITLKPAGAQTFDPSDDGLSLEDIIIDGAGSVTMQDDVTTESLTVTSGELDVGVYNLTSTGLTDITGTLTMGASADTGLTTAGLTFNAGSIKTFDQLSNVYNSGNFSAPNADISSGDYRGHYHQTANGNYINQHYKNGWYRFTVDVGVTLTLTASSYTSWGNLSSMTWTNNGTIALGGSTMYMNGRTYTFGVSSDITGTGTINLYNTTDATVNNNKVGNYSCTGSMLFRVFGVSTWCYIPGNLPFGNKSYLLQQVSVTYTRYFRFRAGTHKMVNLTLDIDVNNAAEISNTSNPNFEISGNIELHGGSGSYTLTYTKGTGSITLGGSSGTQTIALDGKSVEEIEVNASGATKQFTEEVVCTDFTNTNGTAQFDENLTTGDLVVSALTKFTPAKTYNVSGITGSNTMQTTSPGSSAYVYYSGESYFSGTLDEVILVDNVPFLQKSGVMIGLGIR